MHVAWYVRKYTQNEVTKKKRDKYQKNECDIRIYPYFFPNSAHFYRFWTSMMRGSESLLLFIRKAMPKSSILSPLS